jgi:hypothetical protein
MTRTSFTDKITQLLRMMISEGERPIIDFVKRSDAEQARLFSLNLTECDGVDKVSKHQRGKAMDIYFIDPVTYDLTPPIKSTSYWHARWEELGGAAMIPWDEGHFEAS